MRLCQVAFPSQQERRTKAASEPLGAVGEGGPRRWPWGRGWSFHRTRFPLPPAESRDSSSGARDGFRGPPVTSASTTRLGAGSSTLPSSYRSGLKVAG